MFIRNWFYKANHLIQINDKKNNDDTEEFICYMTTKLGIHLIKETN